ncbi:MAG: hypothetical protein BWY74_00029 [Firmicutes bacterium ADurb.Bin419]|nr:MAG: hypothetical protein BWY74_00029 [Firmicutes bacterium ADurb.Bin419]
MFKKLFLISMIFSIFLSSFVFAYAATPAPTPNSNHSETPSPQKASDDDEFKKESRNWFQSIGDRLGSLTKGIGEIVDNVKTLFRDGLKTLLEKTIGGILESYFQLVAAGMSKWVFLVPPLWESSWIAQLWWICFLLSIGIFALSASFTMIGYLTGKKEEFNGGQLLKSLFVAMFFSSFSYILASGIVEFFNFASNTFARETLWEQYELAKTAAINNPLVAATPLSKDTIGFQDFNGIDICKMAFSGQITSGAFYEIFLSIGGLISMILSMVLLSIICIFGFLRYMIIGALAAGAPIWFAICAYTGDTRPAWGWTNLFSRTVLLSFFFDLAWLFSVSAAKNPDDFMGSQQLISTFLFLIALIIAIYFWFKWVAKSVMQPVTLAGAEARNTIGDKMVGLGKLANQTGSRFGISQLRSFGNNLQAQGHEQQKIADEIKKSGGINPEKGSIKDRLRTASLDAEREFMKREGSVDSGYVSSEGVKNVAVQRSLSQLKVSGMDNDRIEKVLSSSNAFYKKDGTGIKVDQSNIKDSVSRIKKDFEKEHMVQGRGGGYTLKNLDQDKLDTIEKELINKSIDYQKTLDNRIMIPDAQKNNFLDTLISFDENDTTDYTDEKPYSLYRFKNKEEASGIFEILNKSLPAGSVMMEDDKVIAVDDTYKTQANKAISDYASYTPYWQEGDYYYYKDYKSGKVIAHLNPPEKGRKIKR